MSDRIPYVATLSCRDGATSFSFDGRCIRLRTPKKLKRYLDVRTWDKGYLVVGAEYDGVATPVEEYIDLEPILDNLYVDKEKFLAPIREVRIA